MIWGTRTPPVYVHTPRVSQMMERRWHGGEGKADRHTGVGEKKLLDGVGEI
jgi:hypothetical protein